MSMQSYGNCELRADIVKINSMYNFQELWDEMAELIEETDATPYEIASNCYDREEEDQAYKELRKVIKSYIDQALLKLNIDIYLNYIDSDSEGTDLQGEMIWCVEPELVKPAKEFSLQWITWSTFG